MARQLFEPLLSRQQGVLGSFLPAGIVVLCSSLSVCLLLGLGFVGSTPWADAPAAQDTYDTSLIAATGKVAMPQWEEGTPMPDKRMGHQGGVNGSHLFVVAGYNGKTIQTSGLAYEISSGTWSALTPLPTSLSDLGATILGGRLFAMGGMAFLPGCPQGLDNFPPTCNISTVYSLDIQSSNAAWKQEAPMPTPRRGLSIASDEGNGVLYAVGGMNCKADCYGKDIDYFDVVEAYDLSSGSWASLPPMPTPRRDLGVALDAFGRLWAVGGCGGRGTSGGACPTLATVEIFDPKAGSWSAPPQLQLPEARHGLLVATDGRRIFAIGGSGSSGVFEAPKPSASAWSLEVSEDLAEASWKRLPDMRKPRYGLNKGYGFVVDGKVYAIGGSIGGTPGKFLAFEPTASMEILSFA